MEMGFAKMDITPGLPCELGGYIKRSKRAERIHTQLFCRCLVGMAHGSYFAIVSLDLLGVDLRLRNEICRQACEVMPIEPECISIMASHTHSAIDGVPDILHKGLWTDDTSHVPVSYRRQLAANVVRCMAEAFSCRRSVRMHWFKAQCAGICSNRRVRGRAADSDVHLLKVYDAETSLTLGGLLHFACHPTVIGPEEYVISADFPAVALAGLERLANGAVFLYANGAAGDISTRFTRKGSNADEADRVGKVLLMALEHMEEIPVSNHGYRVDIAPFDFIDRRTGKQVQSILQTIEFGGMNLWMVPGEPFSSYAMALKHHDDRNLMIGYANDYIGYIPDKEALAIGGYEVEVNRMSPDDIDRLSNYWPNGR